MYEEIIRCCTHTRKYFSFIFAANKTHHINFSRNYLLPRTFNLNISLLVRMCVRFRLHVCMLRILISMLISFLFINRSNLSSVGMSALRVVHKRLIGISFFHPHGWVLRQHFITLQIFVLTILEIVGIDLHKFHYEIFLDTFNFWLCNQIHKLIISWIIFINWYLSEAWENFI